MKKRPQFSRQNGVSCFLRPCSNQRCGFLRVSEWSVGGQRTHPGDSSDHCSVLSGHSDSLGDLISPVFVFPFMHQISQAERFEWVMVAELLTPQLSRAGRRGPQFGYFWPLGICPLYLSILHKQSHVLSALGKTTTTREALSYTTLM